VAGALGQAGKIEEASTALLEALEAARAIEEATRRAEALSAVAVALAQTGHSALALEAARAIEEAAERSETLRAVAAALGQTGKLEEASTALLEALEAARAIEEAAERSETLRAVAGALAQAGYSAQVLETARASEFTYRRTEALGLGRVDEFTMWT
jgi:tetratricopeptide (TPR) repeat protein